MVEALQYVAVLFGKVHLYLLYALLISFILEKVGGLYLFFASFLEKKTDFRADGAASFWAVNYFLFGLAVASIDLFYYGQGPSEFPVWFLLGVFLLPYTAASRVVYLFIFHYQGRKKLMPARKDFNKHYRKLRRKLRKWFMPPKSS